MTTYDAPPALRPVAGPRPATTQAVVYMFLPTTPQWVLPSRHPQTTSPLAKEAGSPRPAECPAAQHTKHKQPSVAQRTGVTLRHARLPLAHSMHPLFAHLLEKVLLVSASGCHVDAQTHHTKHVLGVCKHHICTSMGVDRPHLDISCCIMLHDESCRCQGGGCSAT